jgi:riboflavin kinase/FMN adenylyltransferase
MDIIKGLNFHITNSAVSLGKFDGLHQGHRLLLEHITAQSGLHPTVFTFQGIFSDSRIYTEKEQSVLLERMGIQREILFPFCPETKAMSPEEFVKEILLDKMDARLICVGEDFHFGRNRQGDVELLDRLSGQYGFSLVTYPKKKWKGETVSSTRIRRTLREGRIEDACHLLGEPYFITGEVVHGNALGRTIGMPTANIIPPKDKLLPLYGVYATTVVVDKRTFRGVTNLGVKPTVGAAVPGVETTLLDFDGNLYGKEIQVYFHHFLRREQKFASLEQLQSQLLQDKLQAVKMLSHV